MNVMRHVTQSISLASTVSKRLHIVIIHDNAVPCSELTNARTYPEPVAHTSLSSESIAIERRADAMHLCKDHASRRV
jgi:hypothetical protein